MSVSGKHQGKRALVAGFVTKASLSKPSLASLQLRKCSPLAFAMYLLLAFCGICRGQGLESLDRGHRVLVEKGLQLEALAFPNETGYFDVDRWAESNFTTLTTYVYPYNTSILPSTPPGIPWSRWLGAGELGDPANADLYSWEKPFASNLIHLDVKDEQDMTDPVELAIAAAAVDSFHAKYPDVIMNTTQWGSQHTAAQLQNYMQMVEPDMLMFDTYPFDGSTAGGSPTELYRDMEKYRKLGLAGNDGTGTRPIPTALYTQTYIRNGHVVSESEIRLNVFSALAFGNKLLNSFVYDNPIHNTGVLPVMFSGDGTVSPTAQFYQVAETNRQASNLGPALVRLISTDVRMIMGRHKQWLWEVDNDLPDGVSSWTSSADPYITNISATNLGSKNDGLRGDVIVGYYNPLLESFDGPEYEDEIYFMVANGLTDSNGSATATAQSVHFNFDFAGSGITSLQRLSRNTGQIEEIPLIHDSGSLYHLDLTLDGGSGDLFKFNTGAPFVGATPWAMDDPMSGHESYYNVNEDNPLYIDASHGVLMNDTDPNGDPLAAIKVSDPANGVVALNPDGSLTYTPNPNWNGTDTFTYKAFDGTSESNEATVNVVVNPITEVTLDIVDNGCPSTGLHSYTLTATGPGITTLSKFTIDGEVHQVFDSESPSEWIGDGSASASQTTDSHVIFGDLRLPDLGGEEWDYVAYPDGPPERVTLETITGGGDSGMGTLNNFDDSIVPIWDAYLKLDASPGEDTVELMQLVVPDGNGFSVILTLLTSEGYDPTTNEVSVLAHDLAFLLPLLTPGDANGDGLVNDADVAILAQHWLQQSGATWAEGDFNGDGTVNDMDATLMAANWHAGIGTAAVPEPSSMVLLLGLAGLLSFIRHRRN